MRRAIGIAALAGLAVAPAAAGATDDARGPWRWELPAGFPVPAVPPGNPMTAAKVELGRHLFYERRLSASGGHSCAGCHRQELAFTDGRARALGSTGELHPRGTMTLGNVAYNASYGWDDPSVGDLETQILGPLFNEHPVELGVGGREREILGRLRGDPLYVELFSAAFPGEDDPVTLANVVRAIACFERTLISGGSPYDRLVYGGEMEALSAPAWRGMRLFFSERLGCAACHAGVNFSGPVQGEAPAFHNTGLYNVGSRGDYPADNPGLRRLTGRVEDTGAFRAPSLRNIALTAPYMHDGSIATLDEVLDHYAAGGRTIAAGPQAGAGRDNPRKSERLRGFELSERERADVVAFLQSLTDREFVTDPRFADPFDEGIAGPDR